MTIREFIDKAIKGGYHGKKWNVSGIAGLEETPYLQCVLLDPLAWQAVGKVDGWFEQEPYDEFQKLEWQPEYKHKMSNMIDALCKGKTIEEYLKDL